MEECNPSVIQSLKYNLEKEYTSLLELLDTFSFFFFKKYTCKFPIYQRTL